MMKRIFHTAFPAVAALLLMCGRGFAADAARKDVQINSGWRTVENADQNSHAGFEQAALDDSSWNLVDVPHNWDDYYGFHQVKHGNLHGSAWYRRPFTLDSADRGRRVFLMFEGVGSYATVWVNGKSAGRHVGGRTSFTLDITDAVSFDSTNIVAVRADEPEGIRDLPWVCGGCDYHPGFSEGSQPLGIFRPVHVIVTSPVRVEPFGVHVWNGSDISAKSAVIHVSTEVKNYGAVSNTVTVISRLVDRTGTAVAEMQGDCALGAGETETLERGTPALLNPHLWSPADPYLYRLKTEIVENGTVIDAVETPFGIRWIEWPAEDSTNRPFLLNGKPVFLNGTAEYEHLLGGSHAFTEEQIRARVMQVRAAGFNAFRDAHQPHNLRYQGYWDRLGILWWPQFSAHIWFNTPEFRTNFTNLLRDWVRERRNSPSVILWGLQNESVMPKEFARECVQIIRELDPTASSQRKITTCNDRGGADWSVPQNWTGTYGGDPSRYANDVGKQLLVGEYGGFRSIDFHEEGPFDLAKNQPRFASESRMATLLETKVRLAAQVETQFCGQFQWIFATHDNPGRSVEGCHDGLRELDQIGVVNNKGLLTSWGEPLDVFYMYRANHAPRDREPMVYIVSHTWPDRWPAAGKKRGIVVYSNCDHVELFNDFKHHSLGTRTRGATGTHFEWDDADIRYNVLYAEGIVNGKVAATDVVLLHDLPGAPHLDALDPDRKNLTAPASGQNYLYRVNCGGPDYTDVNGNVWMADRHFEKGDGWGSVSWADNFADVPPDFASMRKISVPIAGTDDEPLLQTFRFGRDKLKYCFSLPDGDYRVELYFVEPWYGAGGGMDCTGWRLFDVAVNDQVIITNLDIWQEAGYARALKKVVTGRATNGKLVVNFPKIASYQAVVSAMAISSSNANVRVPPMPEPLIKNLVVADRANATACSTRACLDAGDKQYGDATGAIAALPQKLVEANWIRTANASRNFKGPELMRFEVTKDAEIYVAHDKRIQPKPAWLANWLDMNETLANNRANGSRFELYRKLVTAGSTVVLGENSTGKSGDADMYTVLVKRAFPPPPPRLIRDFLVDGAANPKDWAAIGKLRTGDLQYSDASRRITGLASGLFGSDWIRTPMSPGGAETLHFTVNQNVDVFVALAARVTNAPGWLSSWIKTGRLLANDEPGGGKFVLYRRRFTANSVVNLNGIGPAAVATGAPMYTVLVTESRPSTVYPAKEARLAGPVLDTQIPGYTDAGYIHFRNAAGDSAEWKVTVGVADIYGLRFRYASSTATVIPMDLQILDAEGKVLSSSRVKFPPVDARDKWGSFQTNTGVNINAGTYTVRLTTTGAGGPELDSLEVE
jgi:hypothetical protein